MHGGRILSDALFAFFGRFLHAIHLLHNVEAEAGGCSHRRSILVLRFGKFLEGRSLTARGGGALPGGNLVELVVGAGGGRDSLGGESVAAGARPLVPL